MKIELTESEKCFVVATIELYTLESFLWSANEDTDDEEIVTTEDERDKRYDLLNDLVAMNKVNVEDLLKRLQ